MGIPCIVCDALESLAVAFVEFTLDCNVHSQTLDEEDLGVSELGHANAVEGVRVCLQVGCVCVEGDFCFLFCAILHRYDFAILDALVRSGVNFVADVLEGVHVWLVVEVAIR